MDQGSSGADPAMKSPEARFGDCGRLGRLTLRGLCGVGLAMLLLTAPALAEGAAPASDNPDSKPAKATATAKHAPSKPTKTTAKKPEPGKKVAAKKSEPKKVAESKKPPALKKTAAAAKKSAPGKTAEQVTVAARERKPQVSSYTITTTMPDHVTYTATRIVPLVPPRPSPPLAPSAAAPPNPVATAASTKPLAPASPAPKVRVAAPAPVMPAARPAPAAKAAVVPVSLPSSAEGVPPQPAKAAPAPAARTLSGPADPATAARVVDTFLREAFRIAKAGGSTSLQRRAQLADLFSRKLDISRIAGYTTADELAGMSPDIQQRFRAILISYLVETYYPRIEMAADPSIAVEVAPLTTLADGTAVVTTRFTKAGWETQSVKWELMAERDGYKIVDIFSAGASLVQMERDTFLSVMRNGGLPELMAKLDARTKALASAATE